MSVKNRGTGGDEISQNRKRGRILAGFPLPKKQNAAGKRERETKELEFFIKGSGETGIFRTVFSENVQNSFCPHKILDISKFVLQNHS